MSAISRRSVVGAALAMPIATIATVAAAQSAVPARYEAFLEQCSNLHPERGRQVAQLAIERGLDPDACEAIQLVDRAAPQLMPRLFFPDPTVAGAVVVIDASSLSH